MSSATPDKVLNDFAASYQPRNGGSGSSLGRSAVYKWAIDNLANVDSIGGEALTATGFNTMDMNIVGFALYEQAGAAYDASNAAPMAAYVKMGNLLLAYREQHDALAGVFNPGRVFAGECDRAQLMQLMTPMIVFKVGNLEWSLYDYCERNNCDVMKFNWGDFSQRFTPILDSFKGVYSNPQSPWPLPLNPAVSADS